MDAVFIYRNRSDNPIYDASTGEMRGGPDKVIVFIDGVLCAMDREAKVTIPVSRWRLAKIGLACLFQALKRQRAAAHSVEPVALATPPPEALPEPPLPEATDRKSPETGWEQMMQEMRDLSR